MKSVAKITVAVFVALLIVSNQAWAQAVVRVPTPIAARCINSRTDEVTITVRRVVTHKTSGFFTSDNKAGVTVISTLNADGTPPAKIPSVNMVDIQNEPTGQVSLLLEYPIASQLELTQGQTTTKNMQLDIFLEKTRGANTFGSVLTTAGQLLGKLPIPANPYTNAANQIFQFANQTIQQETTGGGAIPVASLTLQFNNRDESDLNRCVNNDFEATGAIAVVGTVAGSGVTPLPTQNFSLNYCTRYVANNTYALQYAKMPATGCGTVTAWAEMPNDYMMLVVAAATVAPPPTRLNTFFEPLDLPSTPKRFQDLQESKKLCDAMNIKSVYCGIQ